MPANPILRTLESLRVPWQLVVGGGGHDGEDDAAALAARTAAVDAWLDHQLLGIGDPPAASRITWVIRPGWEHAEALSFGPDSEQTLYLRHGGILAQDPATSPVPNLNITHVPRDPSYDLARALHTDLVGTLDAWPREDVRFDGPALDEALDLRGAPRFRLHLLPEHPWVQVQAELWDVAPDGAAARISRAPWGTRTATPGMHLNVEMEGRAVAWRVAAGHRLRVVISDQDPQHVLPEYRAYRARLFVDDVRASCVVVPVG